MQKFNKPLIILFITLSSSLAYADTNKKVEKSYERPLSTEYKSFNIHQIHFYVIIILWQNCIYTTEAIRLLKNLFS